MTATNPTSAIESYIVELLLKKGPIPAGTPPEHYRFLDVGHIDSMGVLNFILDLEERFGISLTEQDLTSEQFRTPAGLAALIAAKLS